MLQSFVQLKLKTTRSFSLFITMLPWNCMKVKTPGHVTEVKCDVLEVCGPAISPVLNNGIAVQHCLHP